MIPPAVEALSDTLATAMRNPAPDGDGVCPVCRGFHDPSWPTCVGCARQPNQLDALTAITYAPQGGQIYRALHDYKNSGYEETRRHHGRRLAAVLWRFAVLNEAKLAKAAGVEAFEMVATVPSKTVERDEERIQLRAIVGQIVGPTAQRWARVLSPTDTTDQGRGFVADRFVASNDVAGKAVLLIDDLWVTGGNLQSAASALRAADAATVAGLTIGRYVVPSFGAGTSWGPVSASYEQLPRRYEWESCDPARF